jgi:hypothetical protein
VKVAVSIDSIPAESHLLVVKALQSEFKIENEGRALLMCG